MAKGSALVGNPELQLLDASELAFFIGVDTELADGLTLLQAKAESLLDAVKVYGRRRLELTDTLSADVQDKMRFKVHSGAGSKDCAARRRTGRIGT